jgi:hypothetical protein
VNANLIATLKMAAAKLVAETAAKVTRKRMFKTCFNALGLSCPQVVCHRFEFLQWGEAVIRSSHQNVASAPRAAV